jgi:hypothetical protein
MRSGLKVLLLAAAGGLLAHLPAMARAGDGIPDQVTAILGNHTLT